MGVKVTATYWKPTVAVESIGGVDVFFASHPYALGVVAQGETREQAEAAFMVNLDHYFEHLRQRGMPTPRPTHVDFVANWSEQTDGENGGTDELVSIGVIRPASAVG